MPESHRWLTSDEAADVAARHGLTLADAVSLQVLADDTDHADLLAARFAHDDETAPSLGAAGAGTGLLASTGSADPSPNQEQP